MDVTYARLRTIPRTQEKNIFEVIQHYSDTVTTVCRVEPDIKDIQNRDKMAHNYYAFTAVFLFPLLISLDKVA